MLKYQKTLSGYYIYKRVAGGKYFLRNQILLIIDVKSSIAAKMNAYFSFGALYFANMNMSQCNTWSLCIC